MKQCKKHFNLNIIVILLFITLLFSPFNNKCLASNTVKGETKAENNIKKESKSQNKSSKKSKNNKEVKIKNIINKKYVNCCIKYGKKYNIDPALLVAMIYYESGGNKNAGANNSCVGLCQINVRYSKYNRKQLLNAETNIKAGAQLLSSLVKKYGETGGLVAYNTGEYSKTFKKYKNSGTNYSKKIIKKKKEIKLM